MNAPSLAIHQLLLEEELVGDWGLFMAFLPDDPDNAICVYDTAGIMDGRMMRTGERIEHPGIQIRVRGPVYKDTWEKANLIALALDTVQKNVVTTEEEDYIIHNVSRTGAIIPVGVEDAGRIRRHHFTMNMILTLQRGEPFNIDLGGEGGALLLSGQ
jgi:hypothetical protein